MLSYRNPAVAGMFYPNHQADLQQSVQALLQQVPTQNNQQPRAIIVPHAGYIYSGLTAAYAYKLLEDYHATIKRVMVLGPSHHVSLKGLAVPNCESFITPLGEVPLDNEEIHNLCELPQVIVSDQAHEQEHSLEVQLPFLQTVLDDFKLIPLVVGQSSAASISMVIEKYLHSPSDLVVISTDLSHFLNYDEAAQKDRLTNQKILNKQGEALDYDDACGRMPLVGMLYAAVLHKLEVELLDLRSSGDTAGDKQRVVGYGAWSVNHVEQ